MKYTFWNYTKTLIKTMPYKVALAIALTLGTSLTEGIGLLFLIPILELAGLNTGQYPQDKITQLISSFFKFTNLPLTLISVLFVYVVIVSMHALLNYCQTMINYSVEQEFTLKLRQALYKAITNANWLFFSKHKASDFTCALTVELDRIEIGTHFLLQLITTIILALIYSSLVLHISPLMTSLVLICGAGLLLLTKRKVSEAHLTGEELSIENSGLYSAAIEHFNGMKTVKSYSKEKENINMFAKIAKHITQINIKAVDNQTKARCTFEIAQVITLCFIFYAAYTILKMKTTSILLLLFLFARIMPKISIVQESFHEIVHMLPAFSKIIALKECCLASTEHKPKHTEKVEFKHTINLENLYFNYDTKNKLFSDLNLIVHAGKITAIVGPSGSGKSTILDLITGLIKPNKGQILIDDISLSVKNLESWKNQIGYVTQETFLFHDTVRSNLLWACPYASDKEINDVLRLANAEQFVHSLPYGLETVIGDRGVSLSGGERQRLGLARALLRKPSLLILDEATSSLDSENEKRIQTTIDNLKNIITILIISHRLSAIRNADVIYILENGNIVKSTSWNNFSGSLTKSLVGT